MEFLFLLTAILFFILGQKLPIWLGYIVKEIEKERLLSKIAPTEIDEHLLCSGPHEWTDAVRDLNGNGEYIYCNICRVCGFIPYANKMLPREGIVQMEANVKQIKESKRHVNEFTEREKEGIRKLFDEELKNGMDFTKLERVYMAGHTMKERYILYRSLSGQKDNKEAK